MWAVSKLGNFLEELDNKGEDEADETDDSNQDPTSIDTSSVSVTGGSVGSSLVGRGLGFLSSARAAAGSAAAVAAKAAETDWAKGAVGNLGSLLGNDDDDEEKDSSLKARPQADGEHPESEIPIAEVSLTADTDNLEGSDIDVDGMRIATREAGTNIETIDGLRREINSNACLRERCEESGVERESLGLKGHLDVAECSVAAKIRVSSETKQDINPEINTNATSQQRYQESEAMHASLHRQIEELESRLAATERMAVVKTEDSCEMEQSLESERGMNMTLRQRCEDSESKCDIFRQQVQEFTCRLDVAERSATTNAELSSEIESNREREMSAMATLRQENEDLTCSVAAVIEKSSKIEQEVECERCTNAKLHERWQESENECDSIHQQKVELKSRLDVAERSAALKIEESSEMGQDLECEILVNAALRQQCAESEAKLKKEESSAIGQSEASMNATLRQRCEESEAACDSFRRQVAELAGRLDVAEGNVIAKTRASSEIAHTLEHEEHMNATLQQRCEESDSELVSLRRKMEESKSSLEHAHTLENEEHMNATLRQRCEESDSELISLRGKMEESKSSLEHNIKVDEIDLKGNVLDNERKMNATLHQRCEASEAEREALSQQVEILKNHLDARERSTTARIAEALKTSQAELAAQVEAAISKTRMETVAEVAARHEEQMKKVVHENELVLLEERAHFASREEALRKRVEELENQGPHDSEALLDQNESGDCQHTHIELQQRLNEMSALRHDEERKHREELENQMVSTTQQVQRLQDRILEAEQESAQKDQKIEELMQRMKAQESVALQAQSCAESELQDTIVKLNAAMQSENSLSRKVEELERSLLAAKRNAHDKMTLERDALLEEAQKDMQDEFNKMMKGKDKEIKRLQNEVSVLDHTMHEQCDEIKRLNKEGDALRSEYERSKKNSQGNLGNYQKDIAALTFEHQQKIKDIEEKRESEERQTNELALNIKKIEERARIEVAQLEIQKSQMEQRLSTLQLELDASRQQFADLSLSLAGAAQLLPHMDSSGKTSEKEEAKIAAEAELRTALERLHVAEDKLLDAQANRDMFAKESDMCRAELKVARDEIRYLEEQFSKSQEQMRDLQSQHIQQERSETPATQTVIERMQKDFEDRMARYRDEVSYLRQKCDEKEKRCEHLLAEKSSLSMELRSSRQPILNETASRDLEGGAEKSIEDAGTLGKANRGLIRSLPLGSPAWLETVDEPLRFVVKQLATYPPARMLLFAYVLLFHIWVFFMLQMSIVKNEDPMPVEASPVLDEPPASEET